MGATIDLYIDTASGALIDGGSVVGGSLPTLTRNDSYTLRLRLLEKGPSGAYEDVDTSSTSVKVGIGDIDEPPTSGTFKLSVNGVTSGEIPYNATATTIYNAISNNVSTVATYGSDAYGSYLLTASQPNTAMSFGGDAFTLFPASSVLISTRRNPNTSVCAQQVVKIIRNPAVFADTFTNTPTASEVVLSKVNDGGTGANETYELSFGPLVRGGLFSFNYGGNSSTGIAPFTSALTVQTQLQSVTGIGAGNISVQEDGKGGYSIQFVGALGQANISTPLQLDSSGVNFIPLRQSTLTINTAEVEDLFETSGGDSITPTLEIEITQDSKPKTVYQGTVTIRKDLINTGAAVPAPQSSYYTKAEIDTLFVSDNSQYLEIANRKLLNSEGDTFLNWESGTIADSTTTCIGFFGATPIQRPSNTSIINAVSSLGLIGSGVTIGVLTFPALDPSSSTTLSITATATIFPDNTTISFGATTGLKFGATTFQKLGFFNSTPVAQPANTNIVSAIVNLGLVASTVTLGDVGASINAVTNWLQNVDATNRRLVSGNIQVDYANALLIDSVGAQAVNWGGRALKINNAVTALNWSFSGVTAYYDLGLSDGTNIVVGTSSGAKIGTSATQKIGFYNATPATQPNQDNVVTALRGIGILAGGPSVSTYGVMPLSPRTLMTAVSLNFGTLAGATSVELTIPVTGARPYDIVNWGVPTSVATGLVFDARVSANDTVALRAFNVDNKNHTAATDTYRILVVGY